MRPPRLDRYLLVPLAALLLACPVRSAAADDCSTDCVDGDAATVDSCVTDGACRHDPCRIVLLSVDGALRSFLAGHGFAVELVAIGDPLPPDLRQACVIIYDAADTRWPDTTVRRGADVVAALAAARNAGVPLLIAGQRLTWDADSVPGAGALTHLRGTCATSGIGRVLPALVDHPIVRGPHGTVEPFDYDGSLARLRASGTGEVVVAIRSAPEQPVVVAYQAAGGGRVVVLAYDPRHVPEGEDRAYSERLLRNALAWLRREGPERFCADDDRCTAEFLGTDGRCGALPVQCLDPADDPCSAARCTAGGGCGLVPACADGDPCTDDGCAPDGTCTATPHCDDGDGCTTDTCDAATGACDHRLVIAPDADGDGAPACNDCDDDDLRVWHGNEELPCNGLDDDCDPATPDVSFEACANGRDDDCDGLIDEFCPCAPMWCPPAALETVAFAQPEEGVTTVSWPPVAAPPLFVLERTALPRGESGCEWDEAEVDVSAGCLSRPAAVVLRSSGPVTWQFRSQHGEAPLVIDRAYLCSPAGSRVEGLPAALVAPCPAPADPGEEPACDGSVAAPDPLAPLEVATGARRAGFLRGPAERFAFGQGCTALCADSCGDPERCGQDPCGMICTECPQGLRCALGTGQCVPTVDCDDRDGDGYGAGPDCFAADCRPDDPRVHPHARPVACNGVDEACGEGDPDAPDADGDGYDACAPGSGALAEDGRPADCDDADAAVHPGALELPCTGRDDDCDPATPDLVDQDGDGWDVCPPDAAVWLDCLPVDCDDTDAGVHPEAFDLPGDGLDADCDGVDPPADDRWTVYVAPDGDDTAPGTAARPKRTIGAGLALAAEAAPADPPGVTRAVFVAEGTYAEDVTATVALHGGFERATWRRDGAAHPTLVDGTVVVRAAAAAAPVDDETTAPGAEPPPPLVLQGFTVRRPPGAPTGLALDPALTLHAEGERVVLAADLTVVGGAALPHSCGVRVEGDGDVRLARARIDGGAGERSTGLCGGGRLRRLILGASVVTGGAGALQARPVALGGVERPAQVWLVASLFVAGPSGPGDSAVQVLADDVRLVDTIVDTRGAAGAAAVAALAGPSGRLRLLHTDLWAPGGVLVRTTEGDLRDRAALAACRWPVCAEFEVVLSADPLYRDPAAGDGRLAAESPCVDAGRDPALWLDWPELNRALDGAPRPAGEEWDIGPFEQAAGPEPPSGEDVGERPDAGPLRVEPLPPREDGAGSDGGGGGCGGCATAPPRGGAGPLGLLLALGMLCARLRLKLRHPANCGAPGRAPTPVNS